MNQNLWVQKPQQLQNVQYDSFQITNHLTKQRYSQPVVTKDCKHLNSCFEYQEAMQEINTNGIYRCQQCQSSAQNSYELIQDWRVQAYNEFNLLTSDISVISGIMVNKYIRNKSKYQSYFQSDLYRNQFLSIVSRASQDSSIISLIKSNMINQKEQNKKIQFWSFCLQDRVKITVPVRIIGCKHYECYELTSLLFYQDQNKQKKQFLDCTQPGCSNRLQIAHKNYSIIDPTPEGNNQNQIQDNQLSEEEQKVLDIETLFSKICIDIDLLNAIKRSNPSSYKFYFDVNSQQIEEDVKIINNKIIDPYIEKYYQCKQDLQQKINFEMFQLSVQQQAALVIQGDILLTDKQLGTKIALYKYRNYDVKMEDQLTKMNIEYPVRCKFCTDLSVCMDMRSYIADFAYQKQMNPNKPYTCLLCKTQQKQIIAQAFIQSYIYIDSNMLSYMFKDMSYTSGTKVFQYKGQQYMLQEFMDRQKIRREDYIVTQKDSQTEFKQLYCVFNQNLRIKQPLVLSNCPLKNIVDFSSFYSELQKIKFEIETKGLVLCKCHECNHKPILTFVGNIHFHEAYYEALNKFYKIEDYESKKSFTYKFQKNEEESYVILEVTSKNPKIQPKQIPKQGDQDNLKNAKTNEGFVDLMNDEEYQKFFGATQIQGYTYKGQGMSQNIGNLLELKYTQKGISANIKEAVEKLNQNASNLLKQYQFNVVGMDVQLKNDVFNQNKGEFKFLK